MMSPSDDPDPIDDADVPQTNGSDGGGGPNGQNGEAGEGRVVVANDNEEEEEVKVVEESKNQQEKHEDAGDPKESGEVRNGDGEPSRVSRGFVLPSQQVDDVSSSLNKTHLSSKEARSSLAELKQIPVGEPGSRSKLRFDVVTARVIETAGKKHVSYSIMIKRLNSIESHSTVIERRYNDFCYVYESILRNFHPSVLGDFLFPKKVLIGNFKAEVITERTEAFHKFLNLIANCDNLLYSDYFYSFLSSEEHNEAVSHLKLSRYEEAIPLLENIFYVREKLLTISNIHVLQCLCELVSTLAAVRRLEAAFSYALVAMRSFDLAKGHPDAEPLRVPFLKLASQLAEDLGQDKRPFEKQLAELRYRGARLENATPLMEVIRERYIHRASHTAKIA